MTHLHRSTLAGAAAIAIVLAACGSTKTAAPAATTPASTATTIAAATTAAPTTAAAPETTAAATPETSTADTTATTEASAATTAAPADAVAVQLADSALGSILQTSDGKTLYVFSKDSGTTSACSGGCASAWPPLAGTVEPGKGLDGEDFATITRDDGTQQVTFYGHPLYFYAGDSAPGDTAGQGEGGVWYVVGSDGNAIDSDAADATTPATKPGY
ncbi:MAG: hypothetical protein JWL72_4161 [Ilumatobacteraceae bacterium]|nr:hypothetical protein [Ilumatobacteraceae bacterium]MCU1390823.1 hypothetical protein [Ilumatobacteraceae bacterium]